MDQIDLLQEKLARMETGEALAMAVEGLPENEAGLLRLAAQLQHLQFPEPSSETVTAHHTRFLQKVRKEQTMNKLNPGILKWMIPLALGLFMCVFLTAMTASLRWWVTRDPQVVNAPAALDTPKALTPPTQADKPTPEGVVANPTAPSVDVVPMPILSLPEYDDPKGANLRDLHGLVEIQDHDGTWLVVNTGHVVAGQRVRTGPFSSVTLQLFDGSQIVMGPDAEISLEKLNAPREGARKVFITQWLGTADHHVTPSADPASEYQVQTPSSTGVAKGTSFQVVVLANLLSRFIVTDGAVHVTSLNITVVVVAGQVVTVNPNEAPSQPVYQIRGEGEVSAIGTTWTIAGQTFQLHEQTVIIGNPQVGDIVRFEGRILGPDVRVLDTILLVQPDAQNRFTLSGPVEDLQPAQWRVAGQLIHVNEQTSIEPGIQIGMTVEVRGVILPDGRLLAESIRLLADHSGFPFEFVGVVQGITPHQWMISNLLIQVNAQTRIDEGVKTGDRVKVTGFIQEGNVWLATSIRRVVDPVGTFDLVGVVSSIHPWVIAGQAITTHERTQIIGDIKVGDTVRARGQVLEDGTWLAREIALVQDDDLFSIIVFIGQVRSIGPWNVGGIPLVVNEQTHIGSNIQMGDLVRVRARLLPDGTYLALSILKLMPPGTGTCIFFTDVVISISATQIILTNGPVIALNNDLTVQGQIQPNSIIIIHTCHTHGVIVIVNIVVIYQLEIIIIPPPPPPGGGGNNNDDDDDDD